MATLYLRSVPDHVVREAKAAAARRGITLTAFVTEALTDIVNAEQPNGAPDDLRSEISWYEAHKDELLRRYRGEYLAIANQRVVDHDKMFGTLARRTFKRLGLRPVFMPKCTEGERLVRIRSPRVARG